jgi:hypothetical protein
MRLKGQMMEAMTRFGYAALRDRRDATTFMFILDQVIISMTIIERNQLTHPPAPRPIYPPN